MQAHRCARLPMIAGALAVVCGACGGASTHTAARTPVPADSASADHGRRATSNETGSVSVIRRNELDRMHGGRIENMIAGRVPGLEVISTGGEYTLRIRGPASFTGNDEPLLVIDGMSVRAGSISSALALLVPQDIERIEVLKDAGAAGLYGARGVNGVVVITTRRR